jgi:heat shock transcription factor, other eukaryote
VACSTITTSIFEAFLTIVDIPSLLEIATSVTMASQGFSRKRPAPGADPMPYYHQLQDAAAAGPLNDGLGPQLSNDQFLQWGQTGQPATGASYNDNSYALNANQYAQGNSQNLPQASNQLARRPMAQLTARGPQPAQDSGAWVDTSNTAANSAENEWGDDIVELEAKAQIAKRDAQSKRKQIPPFVQKLNR